MRNLSHQEARQFYDNFGAKQDAQSFYEDKAIKVLLDHADFEHARAVLEFGCGTGRLAEKLVKDYLPKNANYYGVDISETMVMLAKQRLQSFGERTQITQTQGEIHLLFDDNLAGTSFDRFLSTYVLDLLAAEEIREMLREAHRMLQNDGILALASLSHGKGLFCRTVTNLWKLIHRINPKWVGGCRPVELSDFINVAQWQVMYQEKISQFGITSEVVVAKKIRVK